MAEEQQLPNQQEQQDTALPATTADQEQKPKPETPAVPQIALDMSKSRSIAAPQEKTETPQVTLDLSKSKPVHQPTVAELNRGATIGPRNRDVSTAEGFNNWLDDVKADVRTGSSSTWVGSMLKFLGAKGTDTGYGHVVGDDYSTNPIGDFMAGPMLGVPTALQALPESYEAVQEAKKGNVRKAVTHAERTVNRAVSGTMQTLGPLGLVAAPEGQALAVVVPAIVAQDAATKTAKYFGADDDTAELVGNTTGVLVGAKVHTKLELENFQNAVNGRVNAESVYKTRAQELDIARQQADAARQRALDAAQRELDGQGTRADTDAARTNSSEAAKNADTAQKAFDAATEARSEATLRLKKFSRGIQEKAVRAARTEADRIKKGQDLSRETLQKAIPAKGTDIYTPDENGNYSKYEIIRSHLDAAKEAGHPVDTIADARNAAEDARQGIESKIEPYLDKYGEESLVDDPAQSPKNIVQGKLDEMARVDGNFRDAMDHLSDFNITDLNVKEGQDLLTKLNDYMRSTKKATNNWDIYNQIETNPKFAAMYFMADAVRDSLYNKLESHQVEGIRPARSETAALIDFRNAADAQLRRNAGVSTVRGSGPNSAIRNLVARLTGKAIKGAGIATGAKMGGTTGAVLGGAIGEMIGEPVQDFISPGDMTRDEHVAQAMKTRGTARKPVEIKGEGTEAQPQPAFPVPPPPRTEGPSALKLTPREHTDLHGDLATHFGLTDLNEKPYAELEKDLRNDLREKKEAGVEWTPEETKLMARVNKADAADLAIKANAEASNIATAAARAKEPETAKLEQKTLADANKLSGRKGPDEISELNPVLQQLGRGRESGFVSNPLAEGMQAHSPALPISDLPEGLTSEDAHIHEWAHTAVGAIDGLEPLEIISDKHFASEPGMGAAAVFDGTSLRNLAQNPDPEQLAMMEAKWLTQKMAGPASHEVFKNMSYEDARSNPATRSDFRQARAIVREIHPDFTPAQVEEVVRGAYERARDFLSNKDIANRVRANAAVRENGLPDTHHASRGRVTQFAEDVRKAYNESTNEPGPDGEPTGEGGKKAAPGKEKESEPGKPAGQQPAGATEKEKIAGGDRVGSATGARRTDEQSAIARGGTGLGERLVEKYGTTSDPSKAGFILSDGRMIPLSGEHDQMLQSVNPEEVSARGYAGPLRQNFINNENAIRTRFRTGRGGQEVVYSIPEKGVTPEQLQKIRQGVGKVGREGNVVMERTDATPEKPLYTRKEFPRVSDVDQMLRDIQAHPEQRVTEPNNWVDKAAATKGEGFSFHPGTGQAPTDGYMVETHLDRGQKYDHPPTAEDIRAFTEKNKDLLSKNPDLFVGGYKNTLGISERFADRAAAEDLGKKTNQISIYDVAGGKEIPTGGTGANRGEEK